MFSFCLTDLQRQQRAQRLPLFLNMSDLPDEKRSLLSSHLADNIVEEVYSTTGGPPNFTIARAEAPSKAVPDVASRDRLDSCR